MGTVGEYAGHVFFWDHQHHFLHSSREQNTYPLAESFTEFIGSLKPDEGPSLWDADVPEAADLIRQTLAHADGILPIQMARLATEFAKAPRPERVVTAILRELFDHTSFHVRRVAVTACRHIREFQVPGLREALVKKLADPEWWVRYDAAWTIRDAGYDEADVRKALSRLAKGITLADAEAELQKSSNPELHARVQARKTLDALEAH